MKMNEDKETKYEVRSVKRKIHENHETPEEVVNGYAEGGKVNSKEWKEYQVASDNINHFNRQNEFIMVDGELVANDVTKMPEYKILNKKFKESLKNVKPLGYAKGGEIHGEVSVKDLESTRVKDLMKKHNVKITSRKDIERAGEGFGQSTDIDYVVLKGNNKDLTIVGKELDLVDKDGKAWSDYEKGGEITSETILDRYSSELEKSLKDWDKDGVRNEYIYMYDGRRDE